MTLRIHMSIHDDDLHKTTAKRNTANGVAGLDGSGNVEDTSGNDCEITNNKDAVNGYAGLDSDSKIPDSTMAGLYKKYVISNDILHNHDNGNYSASTSYTKVKTVTINSLYPNPSTIRIKFEIRKMSGGGASYGKIYKNGIAIGIERINDTASYVTYSEDISFNDGDTIELWVYVHTGGAVFYRNFRVYGTETQKTLQQAITDNHVGLTDPFSGTNS